MIADQLGREGPFSEFTGYYASLPSEQPVVNVKRVYYRDDPILDRFADATTIGFLL